MNQAALEQMLTWNRWLILATTGYLIALLLVVGHLGYPWLKGLIVFRAKPVSWVWSGINEWITRVAQFSLTWRLAAVLLIARKWID